jgi:hypothetical protein
MHGNVLHMNLEKSFSFLILHVLDVKNPYIFLSVVTYTDKALAFLKQSVFFLHTHILD